MNEWAQSKNIIFVSISDTLSKILSQIMSYNLKSNIQIVSMNDVFRTIMGPIIAGVITDGKLDSVLRIIE